uniref:Glutamate-rich WD repeat-containing protein 1 n=1 Tax=Myxobolus squamalis TaxID=59785 RepID=A0A6B2G5H4_MYXSQ
MSSLMLQENTSIIEDIKWSNKENDILASCGSDGAVRIWDCRCNARKCVAHVLASDSSVGVISWSQNRPLILSGSDLGEIKIWDLRVLGLDCPSSAFFNYHQKEITSIEWHPSESTIFAASSDDNQITLWDLSAEECDDSDEQAGVLPPQLMFIHMGQKEIKEIHWHRQYPGLIGSVDIDGYNLFKASNV